MCLAHRKELGFRASETERAFLRALVWARTLSYDGLLLSQMPLSTELYNWFSERAKTCTVSCLLSNGVYRYGAVTTSSVEQLNSLFSEIHEDPILNVITLIMNPLFSYLCQWYEKSKEITGIKKELTQFVEREHEQLYSSSLVCFVFQKGHENDFLVFCCSKRKILCRVLCAFFVELLLWALL